MMSLIAEIDWTTELTELIYRLTRLARLTDWLTDLGGVWKDKTRRAICYWIWTLVEDTNELDTRKVRKLASSQLWCNRLFLFFLWKQKLNEINRVWPTCSFSSLFRPSFPFLPFSNPVSTSSCHFYNNLKVVAQCMKTINNVIKS